MSSCNICLEQFDSDENRPIVGFCGHTVCNTCCEKLGDECPTCRITISFRCPATNYQLLELIRENSCNVFANYGMMKNNLKQLLQESKEQMEEYYEARKKRSPYERLLGNYRKPEEVKEEIEEKMKRALECWEKLKKKYGKVEEAINTLNNEHEKLEREVKKALPAAVFKCNYCKSVLPKNDTTNDVIHIRCPSCRWSNTIGEFKDGHKWAFMCCYLPGHYDYYTTHEQLFPVEDIGKKGKCQICGEFGSIHGCTDGALWEPNTSSLFK